MRSAFLMLLFLAPLGLFAQQNQAGAREISTDELARMVEKKENFFFLDVREPEELEKLGTIKGYVNIPLSQLEKRLAEVPHDRLIVTA